MPTANPQAPTDAETSFDGVRDWATTLADTWYLRDGLDRFAVDGLQPGRALRVEVFNLFLSIGLASSGLASDLDRGGLGSRLKSRGLDRAVRSWLMRTQRLCLPARKASARVAFRLGDGDTLRAIGTGGGRCDHAGRGAGRIGCRSARSSLLEGKRDRG